MFGFETVGVRRLFESSFDAFHVKTDRIYRVLTEHRHPGRAALGNPVKSLKAE